MKKLIILIFVLFGMVTSAWASSYSGSISNGNGMFISHTAWSTAEFSWTVDDETNTGFWTYDYEWTAEARSLSHLDIEVSENFERSDLDSYSSWGTSTNLEGPQLFEEKYGTIFGIKWNLDGDGDILYFHLTLQSPRMPMWGDFYAKNGLGSSVYARNFLFGSDTTVPIGDGNNGGFVLVPDTIVPIPSAIWLLGPAFIGLMEFRRRYRR